MKQMKKSEYSIFIFLLICVYPSLAYAQNVNWRSYVEQLAEEEIVNITVVENIYEELLNLETNPLNLNSVTREELEKIPLLNLEEVESILKFLETNRPIMTVYELRNVPNLNFKTIQLIIPFFSAKKEETDNIIDLKSGQNVSKALKHGRNELQIRFDKTLSPRAGYGEFSDSILQKYPNRKYRGENFFQSLRYSYRYRDKIQMGFTAEKDAGEPFFESGYPKGYDHYGFHLIFSDIGIANNIISLKRVALGDYRLSFGQGLVLNNDFSGSKSWSIDNVAKRTIKPKRHFSTAESGFFRGGAALFEIRDISITTFYSNRLIDANLSDEGDITSFKVDGLHRTLLEINKKRNTREQVVGTNINFRRNRFQAGINGVYYEYNRMLNPTERDYNLYYLRDKSNYNASVDYSYQLPGFIIAGESAISKNGSVATLNTLQYRPSADLSFTVLHRYFPVTYNALYAQAFSEGSRVQNEQSLYFGASLKPFKRFTTSAYIDFIKFPWYRYGVDAPSNSIDIYLLSSYAISDNSFLEARYKYKMKEKNMAYPDTKSRTVLPYDTQKIRFRYSLDAYNGWNLRTTADFSKYKVEHFPNEYGMMISQNLSYRGFGRVTGDAFIAWFNAETYNARLYSYERNLLPSFYMPSFYKKGIRLALSTKYEISSSVTFSFKLGYTNYFNRDAIGSGTEMIDGNIRTDIYTYLRWRF